MHITSFGVDEHEAAVGELRASDVDTKDVPAWSGTTDPADLASFRTAEIEGRPLFRELDARGHAAREKKNRRPKHDR